jgi:hypothetical protein
MRTRFAVATEDDPMPRTSRFAAFAAALCTSAASAAEAACMAETYTTVCRDGARELRIIRDTVSPSGAYGVAWEVPTDGTAQEWERNGEHDGSKLAGEYDGARRGAPIKNFLVRLSDGKLLRRLAGDHMGDHPFYNQREIVVTWSPDGRYVAILHQTKWTTNVADVHFVSEGAVSNTVSLRSICRNITSAEVKKRQRKIHDEYLVGVNVSSVGNDDTITAKCTMEAPKRDNFEMGIRLRLMPRGGDLKAELLITRMCGDDDERDICANPPSRD